MADERELTLDDLLRGDPVRREEFLELLRWVEAIERRLGLKP